MSAYTDLLLQSGLAAQGIAFDPGWGLPDGSAPPPVTQPGDAYKGLTPDQLLTLGLKVVNGQLVKVAPGEGGPGGDTAKTTPGGGGTGTRKTTTADPGMSTGVKVALGVGAALAVIGVAIALKKKRLGGVNGLGCLCADGQLGCPCETVNGLEGLEGLGCPCGNCISGCSGGLAGLNGHRKPRRKSRKGHRKSKRSSKSRRH